MTKKDLTSQNNTSEGRMLQNLLPAISRRQFIASAGTGALVAGVVWNHDAILDSFTHQTAAEEHFLKFPDSFPGVKTIEKVRWRGSSHCLVYVMQVHTKLSSNDNELEGAKLSQESIRNVLTGFRDDPRIRLTSVFVEGECGPGFVSEMKIIDQIFRAAKGDTAARRQFMALLPTLSPDVQLSIKKILDNPARMRRIAEFPGTMSAAHDVERLGIKLHAGENEKLRAMEGENYHVIESRNREILRKVVASGDPLSFVVFGAAHNFKHTISLWNKENPKSRFSLINVMPEGTYQAWKRGLITSDPNFDPTK